MTWRVQLRRVGFLFIFFSACTNSFIFGATSTWAGPGSNFDDATNWSSGIPTDIAAFGSASPQSISIGFDLSNPINSVVTELNGLTFNPGAPSYTITVPGSGAGVYFLMLDGPGITNNSSNAQNLNVKGGITFFNNTATAANLTILNNDDLTDGDQYGDTVFEGSSTASNATITNSHGQVNVENTATLAQAQITNNGGVNLFNTSNAGMATINSIGGGVSFNDSASASSATITNNAGTHLNFYQNSTGGNATIINQNGAITTFFDNSSAENAAITNNAGGIVDISNLADAGMTAGSISGSGSYMLGSKSLTVGSNGLDTTVSGVISGIDGSLVKVGTGTLTLSGVNTYTGATTINAGTLQAGAANSFSSGSAMTLANTATAILNLNGFNQTIGSLAGGGSSGGNVSLGSGNLTTGADNTSTSYAGVLSGPGSLIKTGNGTFTLSGTNTYMGGTVIRAGTLSIGSDSTLGNASGIVSFTGNGTLQTNAAIVSSRMISLTSAGTFDTNGFNSDLSGVISGPGTFTKVGAGTLMLSGMNNYTGATAINAGSLQAVAPNTFSSASAVVLSNTAGAALDLNGFDQSIGSLAGGGAAGGNVTLGIATLTLGADNTSTAYAGIIGGTGDLVKMGNGTLTLSGTNAYAGLTTINAGAVNLSGSLSGDAMVTSGGVLEGTGQLGQLTNRGTVSPGTNGVGTLGVSGYSGSGALTIQISGSNNTALVVSGPADISNGALHVTAANIMTGRYTVLSAASLSGTFASVDAPQSLFLTSQAEYTASDVLLNIINNGISFASLAQTSNEKAVASAIDAAQPTATGDFKTLLNSLFLLASPSAARDAYDQMSGDALTSFQNIVLSETEAFTQQMHDRFRSVSRDLDQAKGGDSQGSMQLAYNGDVQALSGLGLGVASTNSGLWSRGLGLNENVQADSAIGSPNYQATTGGFQAGYDYWITEDALIGMSFGYAKSSLSVDDRLSSGDSTAEASGLYANYLHGPWFVNGSLAYTGAQNTMTRSIQFPGINEQASTNFTSRVLTSFAEVGQVVMPHRSFQLEPSVSLRYSHLQQDGFSESGAPGLDLTAGDQTVNSLVSAAGLRLSHRFHAQTSHPLVVGARTAWQHELADVNNALSMQFADASGSAPFTVQGTPRSRNTAAIGLDGSVILATNLQGFVDYSATLSSGQNTQGIFGGLRVNW